MGNAMGEPLDGEDIEVCHPELSGFAEAKTQCDFHEMQREPVEDHGPTSTFTRQEHFCIEQDPSKIAHANISLSPNSSFPLSDSELPETFDSYNQSDMYEFLAIPPETNPDISNHDKEQVAISRPQDVEAPSDFQSQEDDADPESNELTAGQQFSQLESTVGNILSSPAPVYPAAAIPEARNSLRQEPRSSEESDLSVHLTPHPVEELPADNERLQQLATATIPEDCPIPVVTTYDDEELRLHLASRPVEQLPVDELRPEDLQRLVTTYADATNLAIKYPELAQEILTHPIPTPSRPESSKPSQSEHIPKVIKPVATPIHHPDRPNWAVAPMEPTNAQPPPGTFGGESAAYVSTKRVRRKRESRGGYDHSMDPPRHSRGTFQDPRGERHEPPPHHRGARKYNQPPSNIPFIERLSDPSNTWITASGGGDDTGTRSSAIQDWGRGLPANYDASATSSFGYSDVGANKEVLNEWELPAADSWSSVPNATNVPPDDINQQISSNLGSDRLGRHIIFPRTNNASPEHHRIRQAFKQQVFDLNIAARSYLTGGSNRGSRKASFSARSDQGAEISGMFDACHAPPLTNACSVENPDEAESLENRFNRVNYSDSQSSVHPNKETLTDKTLTPKLRTDESPFRDTQLRTINSPHASQIPFGHSSNSKLHMTSDVSSIESQENHPASNNGIDPADEWFPVRHSADDWLPPKTPDQHRLAPFRVLHPADDWDAPSKPSASDNSNSLHVTRNADPSHPSGPDLPTNRTTTRFDHEAPSVNIGPGPDAKHGYTRRLRKRLPNQMEAFCQHLAETYPSEYGGRGRVWRAGVMNPAAQYAQPRRDPYGPRDEDALDTTNWRQARK
ncbi:hypothetical protein C0991_003577 [Blastosporella zonata]|nr:hypothetical protein C0991_003577 [Blastosporella zonata]